MIDNPEWPVSRIAEEYSLTPGEIYAAWSYYYDHKEEVEERRRQDEEMVEKMNIPHISEFPGYAEYMEKHKQTEK